MNSARRQAKHLRDSYRAAQKLDTIGMAVQVIEDNGQVLVTTLTQLPWTLGHGAWVAGVAGKSGGFDCARISPVAERKAA